MFDNSHKRYNLRSFKECLKILKKKLPPAYPVTIKYVDIGDFGVAELKKKRFILYINPMQCEDLAIETLLHEWAHLISWAVGNNWYKWGEYHGPEWGIAFSRIYQVLYEK